MAPPPIITGGCHCKSIIYSFTVSPDTTLPLEGTYDHRAALRRSIGSPCVLYTPIPEAYLTFKEGASVGLTTYSSASFGTLSFCAKCGTTLFLHDDRYHKQILVLASTVDIATSTTGGDNKVLGLRDLVVPEQHIYVGEAYRGGVSRFMNDGLPRLHHGAEGGLWKAEDIPEPETKLEPIDKNLLQGHCHCNGVSFIIHRAEETYPQDPVLKEWVKPGQKYCASYCFCHSCRLVSGAPFWVWAFIPRKQLRFAAANTLQTYGSFKDSTRSVTRRFCSHCGCHLFFTSSSAGGQMWDVAVGTLDQRTYESQDWFMWRFSPEHGDAEVDGYIDSWKLGRMGFENFGREYCRELVGEVVTGLKQNL